MRNRILRVFGFLLLAFAAANALTACGSSKAQIERVVKREFQEKMQTFPFNKFNIAVQQVKLIKAGRRRYSGEVIVVGNGVHSSIGIDVQIGGRTILWKEKNYMDYLPIFGSEILNMLNGSFNSP
jgi:hypothetical protein